MLLLLFFQAYCFATFFDLPLRLTWIASMMSWFGRPDTYHVASVIMSFVEISRRCMWALFRLEHEHLVNVEGYRAVSAVPLLLQPTHDGHLGIPALANSEARQRETMQQMMGDGSGLGGEHAGHPPVPNDLFLAQAIITNVESRMVEVQSPYQVGNDDDEDD
jgi:hypothetical protein